MHSFERPDHFVKRSSGFTNANKMITKTITFGIKNGSCETLFFFPPFLSLPFPFSCLFPFLFPLFLLWNIPEIWNYLDINFENGLAPLIFYCLPWSTKDTRAAYSSQWDFLSLFIFICIFSRNHPDVRSGTNYIYNYIYIYILYWSKSAQFFLPVGTWKG